MMDFIRLIRPINLLIISISQILFYIAFIVPQSSLTELSIQNSSPLFFIIVLSLLAAICGYIINQYFDSQTDLINNKNQWDLSSKTLWSMYFILAIVGNMTCLLLAIKYSLLHLWWIYPVSYILLYLYSYSWQRISTLGNLIVAIFSAGVMAILYVIPKINHFELNELYPLGYLFIAFAFTISWIREIVKDIEDRTGDKASDYQTLIITLGFNKTKAVCLFLSILLLLIEFMALYWLYEYKLGWMIAFALLIIPHHLFLLQKMNQWKEAADHSFFSKRLKIHMALGMLFLLVIIVFP